MKNILVGALLFGLGTVAGAGGLWAQEMSVPIVYVAEAAVIKPTHAQEVWIDALEWCESRGKVTAINPKDLDNTPSYGGFQFKPSTFDALSKKYNIATTSLMSEPEQRAIVEQMVLDPSTNWHQQFPDCTKNHIGLPPKY